MKLVREQWLAQFREDYKDSDDDTPDYLKAVETIILQAQDPFKAYGPFQRFVSRAHEPAGKRLKMLLDTLLELGQLDKVKYKAFKAEFVELLTGAADDETENYAV